MNVDVAPIKGDDFSAATTIDGSTIRVRLRGNADMRVKDGLDSLLTKLHAEAVRISATEVAIDLTELEFMNSSCFKGFVSWISSVQELDAAKKYRIRLLSKPELLWQRRSLHALRCFAVDLVTIEG